MIQSNASKLQDRSRLVDLLMDLSDVKSASTKYNLAERLGHLVGVSGSMNLAQGLRQISALQLEHQPSVTEFSDALAELEKDLFASRERMMRVIIGSFSPQNSEVQNKLPSVATGVRAQALLTFEPYQRFYTTHQIEMAVAIKSLRVRIRQSMAMFSEELLQLAQMDKVMEESLETHIRTLFNIVPKTLEQSFKNQIKQRPKDADEESFEWLEPFYSDMRELLLAEFDARLQPVLGLLEALNQHLSTLS